MEFIKWHKCGATNVSISFKALIEIWSLPVALVPLAFLNISKVWSIVIGFRVQLLLFLSISDVRNLRAENLGVVNLFLRVVILSIKNWLAILAIFLVEVTFYIIKYNHSRWNYFIFITKVLNC